MLELGLKIVEWDDHVVVIMFDVGLPVMATLAAQWDVPSRTVVLVLDKVSIWVSASTRNICLKAQKQTEQHAGVSYYSQQKTYHMCTILSSKALMDRQIYRWLYSHLKSKGVGSNNMETCQ